jgi:hypothetical protein
MAILRARIVKWLVAWPAYGGAQQADYSGPRWLQASVPVVEPAAGAKEKSMTGTNTATTARKLVKQSKPLPQPTVAG